MADKSGNDQALRLINPIQTTCLVVLTVISVGMVLIYTRSIMIPFVFSLFIAFATKPIVTILERRAKMPRGVAIGAVAIAVGLGLALLSMLLSGAARELVGNIGPYKQKMAEIADLVLLRVEAFGFDTSREDIVAGLQELPVFDYLRSTASAVMSILFDTILVIIFVMFLLTGGFGDGKQSEFVTAIDKNLRTYLFTKFITSSVTGLLTGIILAIVGLDMAAVFGLLAFLLNFIPTIGSLVAVCLPIPIALLQFSSPVWIGVAIGLPGVVQFVIGNVIEPKVMGESLDLHPVTVMLSLMFWGLLWGIPGMLLATPFAVVIKLLVAQSPWPYLADLMAGRMSIEAPSKTKAEA